MATVIERDNTTAPAPLSMGEMRGIRKLLERIRDEQYRRQREMASAARRLAEEIAQFQADHEEEVAQ